MKIHSYYCIVEDSLSVYLPVRCYELTLKHRLLEQLGGFSHLLLDALTLLPEQGITWVLDVTGLSPQQLQPIINRMEGLGLVKEGRLSRQGELLTRWKRLLHGQRREVWLDGQHNSHSFCGDASLEIAARNEAEETFVIRRWQRNTGKPRAWSCQDWNEDCERQKKRIMGVPTEYLGAVFDTFHDCFGDTGFHVNEWELSVRYVPQENVEMAALKVPLEVADLQPGGTSEYTLVSPVLCLDTYYCLPDGAPAELREHQPEDQRHIVSFSSAVVVPKKLLDEPTSTWCWPEVGAVDRQQAAEHVFQKLAVSTPLAGEALFNRQHSLVKRWQEFCIDWAVVVERLQDIEGIHPIRGGR